MTEQIIWGIQVRKHKDARVKNIASNEKYCYSTLLSRIAIVGTYQVSYFRSNTSYTDGSHCIAVFILALVVIPCLYSSNYLFSIKKQWKKPLVVIPGIKCWNILDIFRNFSGLLFANYNLETIPNYFWKCVRVLKAHWQISKKQCFKMYCSCDQACQFTAS